MRVLLRNSRIGLYYAGRKHWVGRPDAAADLGTIERAAELSREEHFEEMEFSWIMTIPLVSLCSPSDTGMADARAGWHAAEVVADDRQFDGIAKLGRPMQ